MIRRDSEVDFGIWRNFSPCELIIPLDTHCLLYTSRHTLCLFLYFRVRFLLWKKARVGHISVSYTHLILPVSACICDANSAALQNLPGTSADISARCFCPLPVSYTHLISFRSVTSREDKARENVPSPSSRTFFPCRKWDPSTVSYTHLDVYKRQSPLL